MKGGKLTFVRCLLSACLTLGFPAWGQEASPSVILHFDSDEGPVQIHIGGALTRDTDAGTLILSGGVSVFGQGGDLISAQEIRLVSEPQAGLPLGQDLNDYDRLYAFGEVFVRQDAAVLQTPEGMVADLNADIFHAFGGAELILESTTVQGDQIQLMLPANEGEAFQAASDPAPAYPRVLARGDLRVSNGTSQLTAETLESDETGALLHLGGSVLIDDPGGTLRAASALYNRDTGAFVLDAAPVDFLGTQEYLQP